EPDRCGVSRDRYPGFFLAWTGRHACVLESPAHPGVAVLRIRSFQYGPGRAPHSVAQETRELWEGYWSPRAAGVRTLVVDVIGNHGGEAPVEYYRLLFPRPFQEQYAQFRNFAELRTPSVLRDALWNNPALLRWHEALTGDGTWGRTPPGEFFPPVPQFCA